MKKLTYYLTTIFLSTLFYTHAFSTVTSTDEFTDLKCTDNIAKVLIGKHSQSNFVYKIESSHKSINLQYLGGDGEGEAYFLSFWKICGKEYVLLYDQKNWHINDVLFLPEYNNNYIQALDLCSVDGKRIQEPTIEILKKNAHANKLQAIKVWKIDQKKFKFIELSPTGVTCESLSISD